MSESLTEPAPVVDPDYIARRLSLPLPLTADQRFLIGEAIGEATADVEAYLRGRPVTPTVFVESGLLPYPDGWALAEAPLVEVISAVPDTYEDGSLTGGFTVTYRAGLDAANDPALRPIRQEVIRRVLEHQSVVSLWQSSQGDGSRRVKSSSVEGQSVSYDYLTPTGEVVSGGGSSAPAAAAEKRLKALDRWRRRSVFQRRGEPYPSGLPTRSGFYG